MRRYQIANKYRGAKGPVPKIRNKYAQKRNCAATVPIHVSVSDLYIPTIDLPILLQEILCGPILGIIINRSQTHECEIGNEAAQFPEKEYINGIFAAL